MARKLAAIAFSLGCLHASSLMALGLGELKLESFLNQPLRANVDLLNMGGLHGDEIRIRLATTEDFDKLGLERAYFLTNISFNVVDDGNGSAHIEIRSEEPVLEPYLDFVVEARWPSGRLLRNYTVLVDPPTLSQATPVVSASERVQQVEGIAPPAKKNEQVPPSSGTHVNLQESTLAPGAMPQRNYNATTDSSPTPGSRYMIGRDQTLWAIANAARPEGVSVHQAMLEIQRLNPDAFINGNINRIKAGYIIYLPNADEIGSTDVAAAQTEVREQNAAWREGRDQERYASKGPSLRISAEPEEAAPATASRPAAGRTAPAAGKEPAKAGSQAAPATATASTASGDAQERVAEMEQELETLQRIVSLKDDQIAALQSALANADGAAKPGAEAQSPTDASAVASPSAEGTPGLPASPEAETAATTTEPAQGAEPTEVTEPAAVAETDAEQTQAESPEPQPVATPEPKAPAKPAPAPAPDEASGFSSYLLYGLGALVLGIGGFVFARRRNAAQELEQNAVLGKSAPLEDVFSDVQLQDPKLELVSDTDEFAEELATSKRNNRGYGEHRNDAYASDVDAADALAEADIYIAYGRHPQAVDLLNNALANEPGNPVYRLKLLEIYTELNNRVAATAQLNKIRELGDPDSTARAEALMDGLGDDESDSGASRTNRHLASGGPGLSPNPFATSYDAAGSMDDEFSGLEIEGQGGNAEDDDLDLSGDFSSGNASSYDDEDLVIAADSNGLSTKLDLARAYLDMGDDDGARQILDEVVADGTDDLKAEARALLNRIGG